MGSPTVFMPTQDMSYFWDVQTKKKRHLLQMKRLTDATILHQWHIEKAHLVKSQSASDPLRVEQAREDARGTDARTSLWSGWKNKITGLQNPQPHSADCKPKISRSDVGLVATAFFHLSSIMPGDTWNRLWCFPHWKTIHHSDICWKESNATLFFFKSKKIHILFYSQYLRQLRSKESFSKKD